MRFSIKLYDHAGVLIVTREQGDKKPRGSTWNSNNPEVDLWGHIKKALVKQGLVLVRQLMWKDMHLVSDHIYYLKTPLRNPTGAPEIYIWDSTYAIRSIAEDFMDDGVIRLNLVGDVYARQPTWRQRLMDVCNTNAIAIEL